MTGVRRRWVTWGAWAGAALCVPAGCVWLGAGRSYLFELGAAYQLQLGLLVGVWLLVCLCVRRWWAGFVSGAAMGLALFGVFAGRPLTLPAVDLSSEPAPGTVRVVSFNIGPLNEAWREDLDRVLGWHPDVVVLIEVSAELNRALRYQDLLKDRGWSWVHRPWVEDRNSPIYILTREPIERVSIGGVPDGERDLLVARIGEGAGSFLCASSHPQSPRSEARWAFGSAALRTSIDAWVGEDDREGLPMIVGIDLNAGPAGSRSWWMRRAGFRPGKPAIGGPGTYPAGGATLKRVQLDDVWARGGARVVAWSSLEPVGSDHRAVVADVRVTGR